MNQPGPFGSQSGHPTGPSGAGGPTGAGGQGDSFAGRPDDGRIVFDRISKNFGQVRAVSDLSFTVEPGSVTGFLGPNGAGKTTALRMLLGLVQPSGGTATIGGRTFAHISNPSTIVGAALEAASFHPGRTARNHLRIYCAAAGIPDQRADEVLELVGLGSAAKRKVRGYSLGMRQRLGLAGTLLGNPRVLILDEPANGLDPEGIRWLRGFMRRMADEGRTVLVSSHQLTEVQAVADRVVILNQGQLIRSGSIDELTAGTDSVLVRTPNADGLIAALPGQATHSREQDGAVRIKGIETAHVGHVAFTAGIELHELRTDKFDLEQLFFSLTQGAYAAPSMEPGQPGAPGQGGPGQGGPPPGYAPPPPGQGPPGQGPPGQGPPGQGPSGQGPSGQGQHQQGFGQQGGQR